MSPFNVKKITTQLKKINKESNKDCDAGVQIIINNMDIYNHLLNLFNTGDSTKIYLLYQMSATIFKQLEKYGIYPDKKTDDSDKEDSFVKMKKNVSGK